MGLIRTLAAVTWDSVVQTVKQVRNATNVIIMLKTNIFISSCVLDIDDCVNINCNNGMCRDLINDYQCDCSAGYNGTFCENSKHKTS